MGDKLRTSESQLEVFELPAYIKYRKIDGYKYQLMEKYVHETQWPLPDALETSRK